MALLLGIGFIAGVITAISPCVLPVLPILLASGASGRKPLHVIAGLVASFSVFTLFATWLLDQLGLPQDTLRKLAIFFLFAMAAVLLVPRAALVIERPLAVFSRLRPKTVGGSGFFFGATLGLVFVPCAGPVLATVTVVAANNNVGARAILLTLFYALGAAVPMLAIAYGGREAAAHLRRHAQTVRVASGAIVAIVAIGLVFHVDDHLATLTPGYTTFLQNKVEDNGTAKRELSKVRGGGAGLAVVHTAKGGLPDYGKAAPFHADGAWINSPPRTLAQLRGKVVLIDFWTYSCINCLRTLPHLKAWYAAYREKGLVIVGVHTPEFAFESKPSNVRAATKDLGVRWPVALDPNYTTWKAYRNEYWPAEYLVDKRGHIRHEHFGEGEYGQTESLIRRLLGDDGTHARQVADATPSGLLTPESYLGYARLTNYAGRNPVPNTFVRYSFPASLPANTLAYDGEWRVGAQAITAGQTARLRLSFAASEVYIVMGGHGTVRSYVDGKPGRTLRVDAERLYTVRTGRPTQGLLELRFSPGVQAYSFTFG